MTLDLGMYLITARVKAQDFARHPLTPGFIAWWAMDPAPAVRVQCPLQSSRGPSGPPGLGMSPLGRETLQGPHAPPGGWVLLLLVLPSLKEGGQGN